MSNEVWTVSAESETQAVARAVSDLVRAGDVLALRGDLGAGKTTFVRFLVHALGGDAAAVSSPTFSLIDEHQLDTFLFVHADLYRLERRDELEPTGLLDYLRDPDCLVAVEWPDKVGGLANDLTCALTITIQNEDRPGSPLRTFAFERFVDVRLETDG